MENYQMFFPCSSTSMQATTSSQVNYNSSFHEDGSNGLLRLKTDSFVQRLEENHHHHHHHHHDLPRTSGGGNTVGGNSSSAGGKKKEKKIKKPRYAFQTRSQVDILDDGYRWRKYGQKAVKNNKFPRSYYRCTHQGCNVKKQVQRLTKDETIVVTTYEGMHTHPIEKPTDNFEQILTQMQIYSSY